MRLSVYSMILVGCLSGTAMADPVDTKAARKMLFSTRGAVMAMQPGTGLDAGQTSVMEAILKQMSAEDVAGYYGAVAVSPAFFDLVARDPGAAALSGLLQVAQKYHNADAAAKVALDACQKARKRGQAGCVIAAHVLPKNWKPQALQMSVDATIVFGSFRRGKGPKAFAISPGGGAYSFASGDGAEGVALTNCNAEAKMKNTGDCNIVIAD